MADSRRLQIIETLKTRCEAILTADGFNTNAGQQVLVNEKPKFGKADPAVAILMIVKEDVIDAQQLGKLFITLPIDFVAMADPEQDAAWRKTELILADIKKAVELADRSLNGLLNGGKNNPEGLLRGSTEVYVRENGSEVAGLLISYGCHYTESWGDPAA